jgi:hypothetical protein
MRETYCLFLDAVESGRRDQEKPCIVGGGNRPLVRFCCISKKSIGSISYILNQYRLNYLHDRLQRLHRKNHQLLIGRTNTLL